MRSIMILNAKGGCGKSTLATNLASYHAGRGARVALVDLDPQGSSIEWLAARPDDRPAITGIAGWEESSRVPRATDVVIYDAPARVHGTDLTALLRRPQTVLIPVLPSPIDIRAAQGFVEEIMSSGRVEREQVRLGMVANRVRENTLVYHALARFLRRQQIPFVGVLRDTQNYIRAAQRGLGIFEMAPSMVAPDIAQWHRPLRWLGSARSMPD